MANSQWSKKMDSLDVMDHFQILILGSVFINR